MSGEIFTEAKLLTFTRAGVPEGKTAATLWSAAPTGFGLRLRKGGAASWIFVYRPKGGGRRVSSRTATIGSWPSLGLKDAKAAAIALAGQVAQMKDPATERRVGKAREKSELRRILDGYDASLKRRAIVNRITILSTLRRGLQPLLTREIDTLTRKDLVARIDALEADGKPGAAQDLRKNARSLLEWSTTKGLTPHNVLAGMRRPKASRAERLDDESKARALSDDEIRAVWIAADTLGAFGGLLRLAMLSAMRRKELSGLEWPDILDDRIVIEAPDAKTGVRHEVPLTPAMRAVLNAQPRTTSPLVFPGRGNARMAGWSKLIVRARRESGVVFGLHDLRRTCRTLMSRLGVGEEIAELAIGHLRRGLVATYNKDTAWAGRVDAFEKVSGHIAQLVGGGDGATVIALPVRAKA